MQRVATVLYRDQQARADLAYWLSRPVAERIAAVEVLRAEAEEAMPPAHAEPRLQRVCRVAQREPR